MHDANEPPVNDPDEEQLLASERDAAETIADEAVPQTAKRLRMATYNIHKGVSAMSRHNRIHDLRAGLHALEADLVFLQEVQGRNDLHAGRFANWPDVAQHTFLAGDKWAEAVYGSNSVRTDGDHGNAMLSRFPLIGHENIDISDHRFESRGLLHCEFDFDGRQVHCLCAHLGLFEESRVRQADAMIARIRSHVPTDAPLIIAGDFNDWRHRLGKRLVESLGVREVFSDHQSRGAALARRATGYVRQQGVRLRRSLDAKGSTAALNDAIEVATNDEPVATTSAPRRLARPARTFPAAFPLLRLDRVYVRGFRIASAQVLSGPTWRKLSDHAPIVAELVLDARVNFEAGNRVDLLRGGSEYFPALIAAIDGARDEVYLETYIYHDDDTGRRITDVLIAAAQRGVQVRVTVDGFGSTNLAAPIRERFDAAGVEYAVFRPENYSWRSGLAWFDRKRLRRLHRKLVMVDRKVAFCGGINILDDLNDPNHGPLESPRFDFAARVEGPIVGPISAYMLNQWLRLDLPHIAKDRVELEAAVETWFTRREWRVGAEGGHVRAAFVTRDNVAHRRSIERAYLSAIKIAKQDVILCNAYYFPGRRFRKYLVAAAKRGVRVRLLLQGRPEYPVQHYASQTLYAELLAAGIEIHEYTRSFLHAKVGVVDDAWATVGSSNIDPFSLLLAREANLVVRDPAFAGMLREQVEQAIANDAQPVHVERLLKTGLFGRAANAMSYAVLRFAVALTGITGQY